MQKLRAPSDLLKLTPSIYTNVVKQLNKDFALSGVSIDWSVDITPDKLWLGLIATLDDLLRNEPEALRNLLYRIDLNEKVVNSLLMENGKRDYLNGLAKQIVGREIQKVLSRLNVNLD